MRRDIAAALERVSEQLPAMIIETLREQWARVAELDKEIGVIERRIKLWHRSNAASRQIAEIPGVGVLSATAVVAEIGDPAAFRSGREFAAWLGLVPRHSGTGGRVRMLGISQRGDRYLRTLLIHGACAVPTSSKALMTLGSRTDGTGFSLSAPSLHPLFKLPSPSSPPARTTSTERGSEPLVRAHCGGVACGPPQRRGGTASRSGQRRMRSSSRASRMARGSGPHFRIARL